MLTRDVSCALLLEPDDRKANKKLEKYLKDRHGAFCSFETNLHKVCKASDCLQIHAGVFHLQKLKKWTDPEAEKQSCSADSPWTKMMFTQSSRTRTETRTRAPHVSPLVPTSASTFETKRLIWHNSPSDIRATLQTHKKTWICSSTGLMGDCHRRFGVIFCRKI